MSKILYRLSKILFLFLMAVVLILILFFQGMPYVCKKEFFLPNIVIAAYRLLVPAPFSQIPQNPIFCTPTAAGVQSAAADGRS